MSGKRNDGLPRRHHAPLGANVARQKVWASMRVMRQFTAKCLATVTETPLDGIRKYLRYLEGAGYVRQVGVQAAGPGRAKLWALVRNTGPLAPRASDHGVTDLNTARTLDPQGNEVEIAHPPKARSYATRGGRR